MSQIDTLKKKLEEQKEINQKLIKRFRERKKQTLKELDIMKERVKDLMYIGDLDERAKYYYNQKKGEIKNDKKNNWSTRNKKYIW